MIELITDRAAVELAEALTSRLLDGSRIRLDVIEEREWTTVILPGPFWRTEPYTRALSRGLRHLGLDVVEGISVYGSVDSTGNPDHSDYLMRVSSDSQSLFDFADKHSAFDYVITTYNLEFAALLISDDYTVFSGPKDFIIAIIENDISQTRSEFKQFAIERLAEHESLAYFRDLAIYYGLWSESNA